MTRAGHWLLLLVMLNALAAGAVGQAGKEMKVDEGALRTKLLAASYLEAKLSEVDAESDDRKFTLKYVHQTKKAKAAGQAKYVEAVRKYNAALGVRSTALETIQKLLADVRAAEMDAFEVEATPIAFHLSAGKGLIVRTLETPAGKDGKPLPTAELKKLRGDGKLPGYQAAAKDVKADRLVRVYVDKSKFKSADAKDPDAVYPITMLVLVPATAGPVEMEFKPILLK
ncbi:MAG: hypothetical protein K2R98_22265 [Gemmataceae bacterium]|nr:hypothetical protein [Gemmataceae bacterium]